MKKQIIAVFFMQLLLQACFVKPKPVYRLIPIENNKQSVWLKGKEYLKFSDMNYDVILSFDEVKNKTIFFNVELKNIGDSILLPTNDLFYCINYDDDKEVLKRDSLSQTLNPEEKEIIADKNISSAEARYAESVNAEGLTRLFDLVQDVGSIGKEKTDQEIKENEERRNNAEINYNSRDNNYISTMNNLEKERSVWSELALRKTTLLPGYIINGKIFFPLVYNCEFINVVFNNNLGNSVFYKIEKH